MSTTEQVLETLKRLVIPGLPQDLDALGIIQNLKVIGGVVAFTLELAPSQASLKDQIEAECRHAVLQLESVQDVAIHVTINPAKKVVSPPLSSIRHAIAIGSGKGGVGKSTVSVNVAMALAETGARVGLLDADIYGPSIPMMLGVGDLKPGVIGQKLQPIEVYGLKLMSMAFLLPNPEDPVVWRGPMIASALRQFVQDVDWGELDYLIVDLPPGTGDIPLSLVKLVPLAGAAIVITPQPVAASIGTKTLRMLQQTQVPILGVIENMSHFVCENCRTETPIFSTGGGKRISEQEGIPFLGSIPLDSKIRQSGDEGKPLFLDEPHSSQAEAFRQVALNIKTQLDARQGAALSR
jgi:ATP-binding protein involved in chromosome partitioning